MGESGGSYCRGMLLAGFYQKHFGFLAADPTGSTGDIFIAKGRLDLIRYQQFFVREMVLQHHHISGVLLVSVSSIS